MLFFLVSSIYAQELNVFPFNDIISGKKTSEIIEPLRHYTISDSLKIELTIKKKGEIDQKYMATGRQWYVNGDAVVRETNFNGSRITLLIKYNEAGYYESWQKIPNEAIVYCVGLKLNTTTTWHGQLYVGDKLCNKMELEEAGSEGINWKTLALFKGDLINATSGTLTYK